MHDTKVIHGVNSARKHALTDILLKQNLSNVASMPPACYWEGCLAFKDPSSYFNTRFCLFNVAALSIRASSHVAPLFENKLPVPTVHA